MIPERLRNPRKRPILSNSKENASALSLLNEKRLVQSVDNDLWELSETIVRGTPVAESRDTDHKLTCFAGSTVSVMPEDQMVEAKENGVMPKSCRFTLCTEKNRLIY